MEKINNGRCLADMSAQEIAEIIESERIEFVTARNKFIAGEISEAEFGNYINLSDWKICFHRQFNLTVGK